MPTIRSKGGTPSEYVPTKNSGAVGGNIPGGDSTVDPFQNSTNCYPSRVIENYANENVHFGTGRDATGRYEVEAARDMNGPLGDQETFPASLAGSPVESPAMRFHKGRAK